MQNEDQPSNVQQEDEQVNLNTQPSEVVDDIQKGCFGSLLLFFGIIGIIIGTIVLVVKI